MEGPTALLAKPHRQRSRPSGFSLVGLVVTLTIVVTLSGVAALFYDTVIEDQKVAIAANEIDEYSLAVRTYVLRHGGLPGEARMDRIQELPPEENPGRDDPGEGWSLGRNPDPSTGELPTFLVAEGLYRQIRLDPWGRLYRLDRDTGEVYSLGPDPWDPGDDVRKAYGTTQKNPLDPDEDPIEVDQIPPVISRVQPVGVVRVPDPQVLAMFSDHFGGTIELDKPGVLKMFIDTDDVMRLAADGFGTVTTGAGMIVYTTNDYYDESTPHHVVVQVKDSAGNIGRREWDFLVDTRPAIAEVLQPPQGEAIRGTSVPVDIHAQDDNLQKVTVRLDFADVTNNFRGFGPTSPSQLPPKTGEVKDYYGRWAQMDTASFEDGIHYITVSAEDSTGRVVSEQVEVTFDNTPPRLDFMVAVDPRGQPPSGVDPQILTTNAPYFEVRALDNIQIAEIEYGYQLYTSPVEPAWDPAAFVGARGSASVTGAEIMVPVDWEGLPPGDWKALLNSGNEVAATTASAAYYTPVTLPQDRFWFQVRAVDLAGNKSTIISTDFIVDLTEVGIVGLAFIDTDPIGAPVPPVPTTAVPATASGVAGQTISGLLPASLSSAMYPTAQTSGHLRFDLLRTQASSVITVLINDFHHNQQRGGFDDQSHPFLASSSYGDWYTTFPMPVTSGTLLVVDNAGEPYHVHGELENPLGTFPTVGALGTGRRENSAHDLPAGEYTATVTLDFATGDDKSDTTTFYVDNAFPDYTSENTLMQQFWGGAVAPVGSFIETLYTSPPATIRLGGRLVDTLGNPSYDQHARVVRVEARRHKDDALPIDDPTGWVQVFPRDGSSAPARVATWGWVDGNPGNSAAEDVMTLETDVAAYLDGAYYMDLRAVDGGGLTTAWRHSFTVNTVGPIITDVMIENARDFQPGGRLLDMASGPSAVTTLEDSFVRFQIRARDERPIDRIEFRITEIGGTSTLGTSIIPISPPSNDTGYQPIGILDQFRDQLGAVFRSAPTSYRLEVFASNTTGHPGEIFTTTLEFKFLVDMAIYAPHYSSIPGDGPLAMRQGEQQVIADYLMSNVENVRSIAIFDSTGRRAEKPVGEVPETSLEQWVSVNSKDGTTDVLVVLDALDDLTWTQMRDNSPNSPATDRSIEAMLESTDGDVLVFSGGASPVSTRFDAGGLRVTGDIQPSWEGLLDLAAGALEDAPHPDQVVATDAGELYQAVSVRARMLLPSLSSYRPADLAGPTAADHYVTKSGRGGLSPSGSGASWELEERFTVDSGDGVLTVKDQGFDGSGVSSHSGANSSPDEGANFVYRNASGGRLAVFYSYGPKDFGGDRKPALAAAAVIEEFIENYLSAIDQPDAVETKVAFVGTNLGDRVTPTTAAAEVDALLWPRYEGGQENYTNLTPGDSGVEAGAVMDITPDGGQMLVIAHQLRDTDDLTVQDPNLGCYLVGSDASRRPLYRNRHALTGYSDPLWGRLASDVTRAVVVGAADQLDPEQDAYVGGLGSSDVAAAVWLYDLASGDVTQVTTVRPNLGASRADISGDGRFVVSVSDLAYRSIDGPGNNWSGAVTTSPPAIMRYDVGSNTFNAGYVNDPDFSDPPVGSCSDFFTKVEPLDVAVSGDGKYVFWTARPTDPACLNGVDQLLISQIVGGAWQTGKITSCRATNPCSFGELGVDVWSHLDASDQAVEGNYPYVVFSTDGNFRRSGQSCGTCTPGSSLHNADGAEPAAAAAAHANRGIYLWRGSFSGSDQFVHLASPGDDDPGNRHAYHPRIAPNGRTFVFEQDSDVAIGLLGWDPDQSSSADGRRIEQRIDVQGGAATAPPGDWTGTGEGLRKVLRGRIRRSDGDPAYGFSSVLQIVAPPDSVGSDGHRIPPIGSPFGGATLPVCSN